MKLKHQIIETQGMSKKKVLLSKYFIANNEGGLKLEQFEVQEPSDFQVLVKIAAFGINRADLLQLKGLYQPPVGESSILGLEFSGEIVSVGSHVTKFEVGQLVAGLCGSGAYSEYFLAHENLLIPLPDDIPLVEAAGFPEVYGTAVFNLFYLHSVKEGQKVLIHSAAGGVGLAAIQLLIENGSEVHAVVGSEEKSKRLECYEIAEIYNYKSGGYESLLESHKDSFDFILDTIGGSLLDLHVKIIKQYGVIQNIGLLGGREGHLDFGKFLTKNLTLSSSTLRSQSLNVKAELCQKLSSQVIGKVASGKLSLNIHEVLDAGEIHKAFEILRSNQNFGKIIVRW